MPGPSDRERLLRLIDGGHEALKELQQEPVKVPLAPSKPVSVSRTLAQWRAKVPFSNRQLTRIAQALLIFFAVLAGLYFALEILKTLRHPSPSASAPATPVPDDNGSGTGLRLVGVDSSGPPVAMLEDLKTGKTYFARVNDRVKDVRVKQIAKNKVTVSVRGRTVELT